MSARRLIVAAMLCVSVAAPAHAQIRASEMGTVSQVIDGTRISVQYYRPRARGRDTLFGVGDRSWGDLWTPGANRATTLEVSKPVKLDKIAVPKGKYSVWFKLHNASSWTVVLDPDFNRHHEDRPDSNAKQIRIPAKVTAAPFTDVLTWSMPELRIDGGLLEFRWERARAALELDVTPSLVMTMSAAEAAPYVGVYSYTTLKDGKPAGVSTLTLLHEDNTLKGFYEPEDSYLKRFALVRISPDWFAPAVYDKNGRIYEVLRPDETWEFTRKAGKVVSFVVRLEDDELFGRAVRKP